MSNLDVAGGEMAAMVMLIVCLYLIDKIDMFRYPAFFYRYKASNNKYCPYGSLVVSDPCSWYT